MAELDFVIHSSHSGDVSASTFKEAVWQAVGLLREFDSAISGRSMGILQWYIQSLHSNGGLHVGFRSKLRTFKNRRRPQDISPVVTSSFLNGFDRIEHRCETPPYLSEFGLRKAGELTGLIGKNGATAFTFTTDQKSVDVTAKAAEHIDKLLPIRRHAIGSVEGKLEAINLHKQSRIIVYHSITNKGVTCVIPDSYIDTVKRYLGKRVVVFGTLYKNINGDTLRVSMDRIALAEELKAGKIGTDPLKHPEFADSLSTAEYMRKIRGEWRI